MAGHIISHFAPTTTDMTSATNFDPPFDRPHAQQILFLSRLADACEWSAVENEVDELVATKARFFPAYEALASGIVQLRRFAEEGVGSGGGGGRCELPSLRLELDPGFCRMLI